MSRLVCGFEHVADFNPVEIWCWNRGLPGGICQLDGNPVIKWSDPIAGTPYLSFAARHAFDRTAATLLDYAHSRTLSPCLRAIPITDATMLDQRSDRFVVAEDRDNFDYLLSVDAWAQLHGARFRTARNTIHRIERRQDIAIRSLPLNDAGTQLQIECLCQRWAEQRGVSPARFLPELTAIRNLFDCRHTSGVFILGAFVDDTLAGFSVNECLRSGMGVGHFAKSDYTFRGVSTYLLHHVCIRLRREGVETLNIEADLGIPGLRQAKGLLHPAGFLKKAMVRAM